MTFNLEKFREAWQLQVAADKLPACAYQVAMRLTWFMNRTKHGEAFPGMARLATDTNLTKRSVIRGTQALEEHGHLRVAHGKYNTTNRYTPLLKPNSTRIPPENAAPKLSLGSDRAVTTLVTGLSPKPLSEPLNEPLSLRPPLTQRPSDGFKTQEERLDEEKRPSEEERVTSEFVALYDAIENLEGRATIGALRKMAQGPGGIGLEDAEVVGVLSACLQHGLVGRNGDKVWVTERGDSFYEDLHSARTASSRVA